MAGIKFECSLCGQRIEVTPDMAGTGINCPMCGGTITVPGVLQAIPVAAVVPDGSLIPAAPAPQLVALASQAPRPIVPAVPQPIPAPRVLTIQTGHLPIRPQEPKPAAGLGWADEWRHQGLVLIGFVSLVIGCISLANHASSVIHQLFCLAACLLGFVAMAKRQLLGSIILLLCTALVLILSKTESPRPPAAPPPAWTEAVRLSAPPAPIPSTPTPSAPIAPAPVVIQAPVQTQVQALVQAPVHVPPPAAPETPKLAPSDDPFRDALSPENSTHPTAAAAPAAKASPADAPAAPPDAGGEPLLETDRLCKLLQEKPEDLSALERLRAEIKSVLDVDKKLRLMAAYSLGSLYNGKTTDAAATKTYLQKQFADHPTITFLSTSTLSDPCPRCLGKGLAETTCQECRGLGKCGPCGGEGSLTLTGLDGKSPTRKCVTCGGSGKCRRCKGSGKSGVACPDCGSTGTKLSPAKVKYYYLSLLAGNTDFAEVSAGAPTPAPPPTPPPAPKPVEPAKTPGKAPAEEAGGEEPPEF